MTCCFSTRASVAPVLSMHLCISSCLWIYPVMLNLLRCMSQETWKYICIYLLSMLKRSSLLKSFLQEHKALCILHCQYHGCWNPGDTRSQSISSHSIDLDCPEYAGLSTKKVTSLENLCFSVTNSIWKTVVNFRTPLSNLIPSLEKKPKTFFSLMKPRMLLDVQLMIFLFFRPQSWYQREMYQASSHCCHQRINWAPDNEVENIGFDSFHQVKIHLICEL